MKLKARIARELRFFKGLSRTLKWVKPIAPDSRELICDDLEAAVDAHRDSPAITFEGKTLTYGEMDALPTATPTGPRSRASPAARRWRCSCPTAPNTCRSGTA